MLSQVALPFTTHEWILPARKNNIREKILSIQHLHNNFEKFSTDDKMLKIFKVSRGSRVMTTESQDSHILFINAVVQAGY